MGQGNLIENRGHVLLLREDNSVKKLRSIEQGLSQSQQLGCTTSTALTNAQSTPLPGP
jgi:hypothetical protein